MTPRRRFLHLAAGAAALSAVSRFAWAQAHPSRSAHYRRLCRRRALGVVGQVPARLATGASLAFTASAPALA